VTDTPGKPWHEHLITAGLTMGPLIVAAAIAWGVVTSRQEAMAGELRGVAVHLDTLDARVQIAERQNAVVLSRLDELRDRQAELNSKLDRWFSK
jgi:hypothetical protein